MSSKGSIMQLSASKRALRLISISLMCSIALALALFMGSAALNSEQTGAVDCASPRNLSVQAALGQSESWRATNAEWIQFKVQKGERYMLQVGGSEGLELKVFDRCSTSASSVPLRNGKLEFTATRDGEYYLLVRSDGASRSAVSGYQAVLSPAAPHRPSSVMAENVPAEVLRRATEFLEELRGSDLAPEWREARINPEIRILYRPDIREPAYYEAIVEKPVVGGFEPAGYIQLAAGEHDYPIVNWDMTGMSNTQELQELAPLGAVLTEVYRLNTLSYVSEYEELTAIGITTVTTDVINLGVLPNKIEGLETLPEEPFELVTQSIDSDGKEEYDGPEELPLLEESAWESWEALKAGYLEEYTPLLNSLKQRASSRWELQENLKQYGETLYKGNQRKIFGLASMTISTIEVSGDGADPKFLKQEEMKEGETLTGLVITVLDEPEDLKTLLPVIVTVNYTSGSSETLKYAIVNYSALVPNAIYLPIIRRTDGVQVAAVEETNAWGPWYYYWADGNTGAITYNQIPRYTGVNTSACWSGCGATAWAMHFAWVDQRANENHATWRNHWGLYRVNGGFGGDVRAPNNQDAGVNNMTWEIRNYLGTFCSGTGGSTYFTRMIDAARYVQPRATAGWRMSTRYDPTGLCWFGACNEAREYARYQIVNRRAPAIIGANNHYPLAYGYAYQSETTCILWWCSTDYNRWFYVNQGWGGSGNGWVDWDDVAFSGIYYPW